MSEDIKAYNAALAEEDAAICNLLAKELSHILPGQKIRYGMHTRYGF